MTLPKRVLARVQKDIKNERPLAKIKRDLESQGYPVKRWFLTQLKAETLGLSKREKQSIQTDLQIKLDPGQFSESQPTNADIMKALEHLQQSVDVLRLS